jgi:hypothetical protein
MAVELYKSTVSYICARECCEPVELWPTVNEKPAGDGQLRYKICSDPCDVMTCWSSSLWQIPIPMLWSCRVVTR